MASWKRSLQQDSIQKRETLHATREYFRQEQWEQKNIKLDERKWVRGEIQESIRAKKVAPKVAAAIETIPIVRPKVAPILFTTPKLEQAPT